MIVGRAEDIFEKIKKDGKQAIDEFIIDQKSEELFLEFKRSSDDGLGSKLSDLDREHLAKAISGFGNSEGGVIVWGIDCSKCKDYADVAHSKYPIQNVKRFVSWLEGIVSSVVRLTLLYIWRSLTLSVQPMRSTQRRADFDCDFQYIV